MSKAVKLKNSIFLSSQSIIHKRGGGWYYLTNILDNIYPIGSIFITMNSTNPSEYFGGTWEKISGGYLYASNNNTLSKTDYAGVGTQSTVLTQNQIPKHTHGNKSLSGYFDMRACDTNGTLDSVLTVSGTVSKNMYTWSGSHARFVTNNNTNPKYTRVTIDNTHEHSSVGNDEGHIHNIATIDVWVWKRIS